MKLLFCALLALLVALPAQAQHEHHNPAPDTTSAMQHDDPGAVPQAGEMHTMPAMEMASFTLPNLPMQRDGSGTSWLPDASPMHAVHDSRGGWDLMLHGAAFLRYTAQDAFDSGSRGVREVDLPNWFMGMASRPVGRHGRVGLRGMFSLDPITEGGNGYPLLFQTGETFEDAPLIDRQHPHDLVSELAVTYGHALGDRAGVFAYVGLPGEPALGPVAFMHRPSAASNPDAPLSHHWQDATHVTFGVATLGLRLGLFMVDGSVFTGREPDENRYNFDRPRVDSYSLRLSANPTDHLALQVSRGFLKSPEALEPDTDVWRTTASAIYNRPLRGGAWTSTLLWGVNAPSGDEDGHGGHGTQHSFLAETDVAPGRQAFYARAEYVQKPAAELGLSSFEDRTFGISTLTLGTARELATAGPLVLSLGVQGALYRVPEALQGAYGTTPVSIEAYLRLSPRLLTMRHAMDTMSR